MPSSTDLDRDGMPNRWEVAHHLNPRVADGASDADHDGLRNLAEYRYRTSPHDEDIDNDGDDDGDEVHDGRASTNVRDADTDDDGMRDGDEDADHDGVANENEDDATESCIGDDDDADADGVSDEDENENGTHVRDADSDDDGVTDGNEVDAHNGKRFEDEDDHADDRCSTSGPGEDDDDQGEDDGAHHGGTDDGRVRRPGTAGARGSAGDDRRSPVYGVCSLLHGGRLVLPDGGLGLGASPAVVPEITGDHLDHSGHRDGEEGSEHARQLHGDQDRDEHGQRVQLDGPGQDQWLQQVVLELLVDDEENRDNDQCRDRVNGGSNDRDDRSERRTDQRDEVGERHEQRDQPRKRHARGEQRDVGQDPADNGDQQIAGEISGDGLRTVGGDRANPGPVVGL